jgi:hypothetical protein
MGIQGAAEPARMVRCSSSAPGDHQPREPEQTQSAREREPVLKDLIGGGDYSVGYVLQQGGPHDAGGGG